MKNGFQDCCKNNQCPNNNFFWMIKNVKVINSNFFASFEISSTKFHAKLSFIIRDRAMVKTSLFP